jgi:hypothetical protein
MRVRAAASVCLASGALGLLLLAGAPPGAPRRSPAPGKLALRSFHFPSGAAPRVEVDDLVGSIAVSAGADDEVVIEARLQGGVPARGGRWQVEASEIEGGVRASARCQGADDSFADCAAGRVDFTLRVPRGSTLALSSVQGSLRVEGAGRSLSLETVSGDIDARGVGAVTASSTLGAIHVEAAASAYLEAGRGDVSARGVVGPLRVAAWEGHSSADAGGSPQRPLFQQFRQWLHLRGERDDASAPVARVR